MKNLNLLWPGSKQFNLCKLFAFPSPSKEFENQFFGIVFAAFGRPDKPLKVDIDFIHLDLNSLSLLYEKETEELKHALLNGTPWEETKEQRFRITEISIALHQKLQFTHGANPAEFPSSDMEGR